MNILVIDDAKLNLLAVQNIVAEYKIECNLILVNSPEEGLKKIESEKIDIILLDIVMPNLSGIDVLKMVRDKHKNIVIIMFTSLTDKKYLKESFDLGANDYINKPIEPIEFISRLKSAIKLREYQCELIESYDNIKNINVELKESNAKLQITQIELINREKLSTIGRFSAGIAHEINTPLGYSISNLYSINKYFSILKENYERINAIIQNNYNNIKDTKYLEELYENKNKIEFIFKDFDTLIKESNEGLNKISYIIKNLIRFTNKKMYDSFQLNYLKEIVEETIILIDSELEYNKFKDIATIDYEIEEESYIKCNRFDIEQVIFNIIMNAIDFFNKSDEKVKILVESCKDEKWSYFSISDNGPGIDENMKDKVFEPFFTTKEIGKGLGLGLSACYDIIVNKYKGEIHVENLPVGGCKFSIKIPN
ncbi:hybrid sensor histidine kinase/response regulator [Clostridium felsineum]|uniref:Stage 0 sporulation protein A homolog n=1 Tax=Clostridium felsineum TaxID=36839 RepID=A0A1S8MAP3_9CLOT|nr:hybrid sensor histidine kinase/response regulator [Clostridium felsineum]URZ02369.1 Sensor histidine kinase RcsC [Clostridium felsineum]URZ04879.1 Sensor histidine kinase RcsC [Clostridium felsineum]URZ09920.1 Sensor histidine kinase RcsC [Clostridium felsineum]URZ18174.1 Sensor histidine kinase RcsC [Clostridium felsineum DSM 794]